MTVIKPAKKSLQILFSQWETELVELFILDVKFEALFLTSTRMDE